ncbi:MAG: 50S ribosomal protein L7/L12 [Candidatus Omnitrophica bacterium]|nr:50S ribosomal protein L7/L12 [Candidatus Omnitrophota bacterium]
MTEEKKQIKGNVEKGKEERAVSQDKKSEIPAEKKKKKEEDKERKPISQEKKEEASLSQKLKDVVGAIEKMTLIELSELVKTLEEKFGVSAAAPVVAAPGVTSVASKESTKDEEKSSFEVVLTAVGDKKIQVIKEIRAVTTLGLKEAKDLVEQAPQTVKKDVNKEEAEEIKKKLEAVGAKVEVK